MIETQPPQKRAELPQRKPWNSLFFCTTTTPVYQPTPLNRIDIQEIGTTNIHLSEPRYSFINQTRFIV
jgi:hypothetical protein